MAAAGDRTQELRNAPSRLRGIIKWLLDNQQRIVDPECVQITFHCGGKEIKAEISEHQRITKDTGPLIH